MRYRYSGPDEGRILAVSGGGIEFPRMQWVDPAEVAEATGIDPRHLTPQLLANLGPDFQAEGPVKAARTRRKNAEKAAEETPAPDPQEPEGDEPETPAEPDEEQT